MANLAIYNGLLQPPKSVADYNAIADEADIRKQTMQSNALSLQAGQMGLVEKQRAVQEANALRGALSQGADPRTPDGQKALLRAAPGLAPELLKSVADAESERAKTQKTQTENAGLVASRFREALPMVRNPQDMAQWLQAQYQDPTLGPMMAQRKPMMQAVSEISQLDPQSFEAMRNQMAMGMDKFIQDQTTKQGQSVTMRGQDITAQTAAANQARQSADNAASRVVQIRGQNLTDARANEANGLQKEAARNQVVETSDGPVLVDKATGTVRPLMGGDGKPLGPKLKDAPAAVQKAMIENGTNLRRAERALELIEGKKVGEAQGDKAATGLKGYLPNQVLNRVDPEGVDTRAAIADLGSLVIHDRSGAAVTVMEFPRLEPFIPSAKDDPATVKKKVRRFVQIYKEEMAATEQAYGKDAGYRQIGRPPEPAAASDIDALIKKYAK